MTSKNIVDLINRLASVKADASSVYTTAEVNSLTNANRELIEANTQTDITNYNSLDSRLSTLINELEKYLPTGALVPFAGSIIPDGYLLGNGVEVLKASYSDLYSVIGDTYGTASSPDKFKLPDFRGRFMQGANGNLGVYLDAGLPNITGILTPMAIKSDFSGDYYLWCNTGGAFSPAVTGNISVFNSSTLDYISARPAGGNFNASRSNSIYKDGVTTVQPPALAVNILIKY